MDGDGGPAEEDLVSKADAFNTMRHSRTCPRLIVQAPEIDRSDKRKLRLHG
jgi:hypothetical protein